MLLYNKKNSIKASHRVAIVGVFVALALIFSYVEALIPINFGVPGIKLGVANLVIVIGLYFLSLPEVWLISMLRILLSGLLFGNVMSLIYSFSGGILSLLAMMLFKKCKVFSIIGVSVIGAAMHNSGQIFAAILVTGTFGIIYYLPILIITAIITGGIMGIISSRILIVFSKRGSIDIKNRLNS